MSKVIMVGDGKKDPGCLVQLFWFAFIGWWLGALWVVIAWLATVSIIGMPVGMWMLNRVPKVMALRDPSSVSGLTIVVTDEATVVQVGGAVQQHNILLRMIWFVFVGSWFSLVWILLAYAICMTFLGLPLGLWMFDRVPTIVSLKR